ncbi:MAG: polyprenol monophosphomannose synthase [Bacteroidia bacterium]|nr:polyprenol monophosphomannose synthase [Bacteroidia bacterium]MDW8345431.1 polyprenol monophosphomannose synthase [Bacteroidia bacterium]
MHKVLVIIPTYNEVENIERMLHTVMQLNIPVNVLVVDDNSQDGTAEAVKSTMNEYPNRIFLVQRSGKLGLGTAYIHGFKWALERDYEFICEMDADFSHNPADLPRLLQACLNGADVSIGSRYKKGVNVVNWPMSRVLMSYFASKYVKFITRLPVHDATAGFVCYRRRVLEKINLDGIKFIGYAFQIEMKFKAWKHKFVLEEVPIIFTDRTAGQSKMSMKIFLEAFFGVIKLKVTSWFKKWD